MSKTISFRISEEDFNTLKERATGTISDFVKSLVLDCLQGCKQAVYKDNCDNCEQRAKLEKELQECEETITVNIDCSTCDKTAALSRALLENAELQVLIGIEY